ncbi:MAG: hypothetical protein V3R94_06875 [Acidobacteriota bacterium]
MIDELWCPNCDDWPEGFIEEETVVTPVDPETGKQLEIVRVFCRGCSFEFKDQRRETEISGPESP